MSNIYLIAAQKKFRFPSVNGLLTTEQLFDLDLTSKSAAKTDLDSVARAVNNELKSISEESFVNHNPDPRRAQFETMLEIVKDVIAIKQAAITEANKRRSKAEERHKILNAMASKKDEALSSASMEELEKQLAALED